MRIQIRLMPALLLLNLCTGVTPGRLFQMATMRSADQALASSASSCWPLKLSNGVVVVVAASSGVPYTEMLLSVSMVNFILNLLGATLCAVITSITRIELNRKAILKEIAHGEWVAMSPRIIAGGSKWQVTAQNWGESGRM